MENQCSQIMLYRKSLKRKLAPMRYEHSLSVSYTCMNLAMCYGCSLDKAELAGLMHDCGKRYSDDIILKKCLKHGLEVTDAEYKALRYMQNTGHGWRSTSTRLRTGKSWMPSAATPQAGRR